MIRKTMAFALGLCLLVSGTALVRAETPMAQSTRDFVTTLEEGGFSYTYKGLNAAGTSESLLLDYNSSVFGSSRIRAEFSLDEGSCRLFLWNMVDYDPEQQSEVAASCDAVNAYYKYVKFFTDSSDNSVTALVDVRLSKSFPCSELVSSSLYSLLYTSENAYEEEFSRYAKGGNTSPSTSLLSLITQRGE